MYDLCVGIDNHNSDSIRVACLDKANLESPWPIELRSFPCLDSFAEYWDDIDSKCRGVVHAGAEFCCEDYFGVLEWLEDRDVSCKLFSLRAYVFDRQIQEYKVPSFFRTAYELAIGTLYRLQAVNFSAKLVSDTYQLELQFKQFVQRLECLRASLPTEDYCPF